jgi:hypothetical protein
MAFMRPFARLSIVTLSFLFTLPLTSPALAAAAVAGTAASWSSRTESYLGAARDRTLEAASARGIALPKDFLAWIDGDAIVRTTVYGCRADPLPVLLKLRSLEIDLGEDAVRRDYTQLALAFAIQDSYAKRGEQGTPWNDADGAQNPEALPDVSPRAPISLEIPGDPRERVDTKDASRPLDRDDHIVNFLEDHPEVEEEIEIKELPPLEYDERGIAKPQRAAVAVKKKIKRPLRAADVIASRALQQEFNAYMAAHGHAEVTIDCGERAVFWGSTAAIEDKALRDRIAEAHELFHDAYRAKGRMPAARDRAPTAAESMAWFIRNDRWAFSDQDRAAREARGVAPDGCPQSRGAKVCPAQARHSGVVDALRPHRPGQRRGIGNRRALPAAGEDRGGPPGHDASRARRHRGSLQRRPRRPALRPLPPPQRRLSHA